MSSIKKLASDTALYGISSILGRALNFLLVPLYTAVFEPAAYGVVSILYIYVGFFNVIYTYGLETAYFRFATRKNNALPAPPSAGPGSAEQKAFNSSFSSILFSSIFLSILLCLLAPQLLQLMDYEWLPVKYIYWLAAIMAIDAIVAIPFARLRLQNRPFIFASIRLINVFLNIGLNLFFLLLCPAILSGEVAWLAGLSPLIEKIYDPSLGIGYVFLSNLIANAFYILLLLPSMLKAKLSIEKNLWREMLVYSFPLLLMGIAGLTNQLIAAPMLRHWLPENFYPKYGTETAVGIFTACYKLSIFMNLAIQSFRFAAEPFFFSKASDKNSPALFSRVMHYFIIVCCLIYFGVSVNLPWLAPLLLRNPLYLEGIGIIPVLLLGYLFYGVYLNLSIWFKLSDRTKFGTWFTGIGAVLTVVLNILLIPLMGYMGAAVASLLVYTSMTVMCFYFGQQYYPIPYKVSAGLLYIAGTVVLSYLLLLLMPEAKWAAIALGLGASLLYLSGIGFYEWKRLRSTV